jgi:hypothetical protein
MGDDYWHVSDDPSADRDGKPDTDLLSDILRDLTEQCIERDQTQQAIDALDPLVHPPQTDADRGKRNLGRQF